MILSPPNILTMSQTTINNRTIEFASPFVRDLADLISKALRIDADGDGKVSLAEGLVLGQSAIVAFMKHYNSAIDALEDLKDADSEERKELIRVFSQGFDLDNDTVETLIERTFAFVEEVITKTISLSSEWKAELS